MQGTLPESSMSPSTTSTTLEDVASVLLASPSAKPRRQAPKSDQPIPEDLAKMGIKVRDFAYESTLPPIRSYIPRQIQPGLPIRQLTEPDTRDDRPTKPQPLYRDVPLHARHVRQPAFADVRSQLLNAEASPSLWGIGASQQSNYSTPSSSQPPLSYFSESQESEPYIRTPTVTPNGSLQWDVASTSAEPASQFDSSSQNPEPELVSYADLGFRDPDELAESQRKPSRVPTEVASNFSSPLSSPPGSLRLISTQSPIKDDTCVDDRRESPSQLNPKATTPNPSSTEAEALPNPDSPRYHLRKRPAPSSPVSTVSRPRSRVRRHPPQPAPSPHPPPTTIQSAHAKAKTRSGHDSPRPVAVRRTTKTTPVR